ncbi:MAG TPA: sensor domain-containing diguanylate cyclase, partial [Telluria sp.]|nr:sensor domain-containing diguanylate cyclase [Telluria sp.]
MRLYISTGTLKSRITVLVIVLVLFAAGLVVLASLYLAERQMRAVAGDQQVTMLASAASLIDEDLDSKQAMLKLLAEELSAGRREGPASVQAFLENHGTLRDEFSNVVVFDSGGTLVASLNDRRAAGTVQMGARAYFRDTVTAGEGVISAPFR